MNEIVARLAEGKVAQGEYCGLVLNCSWPMPEEVIRKYEIFREKLLAVMPKKAYIYPAETLHCTICTLRAFTAGPLEPDAMSRWRPVLDAARALPTWPQGAFRLKMGPPTLEGAAAIFRFEDDGAIAAMRSSLREAICSAGGVAAEGCDRSKAKPLPGTAEGDPPPHLPDIVHSTVLRWTAEPSESDLEELGAAGSCSLHGQSCYRGHPVYAHPG
ncbi:unnamed protein product [Effrenium voratum]|uniref:Uncharacterized protein n=1 Tax=Effrenium voratum TaxID=2562239 RepID=A0AA36HL25_9DINO|nr:unnamed protein product [Effrenium voratum]CAJ1370314.1 unnamed protein product [Effrenium voratum]